MRLSYSKISDYETCNRKFWFTYIKGVPIQQNKYLIAGKEVHEILFNSTLQEDWKKYLQQHPKYNEYKPMIDNYMAYQDNIIKVGGNPIPESAEVKFHDDEYDFSLVIDRVDTFNGKVLLMDYKTDSTVDQDKHDKQLLLYSYFYNKNFPEKPVTHYAPFFVKKAKSIKTKELTKEKMEEALEWLKKNKMEIESKGTDHHNYPPKPSSGCNFCSHRMTGICKEGVKYFQDMADLDKPVEMDENISMEQKKLE